MDPQDTILVTGARGALGRLVVADLIGSEHRIVAGTRHPDEPGLHYPAGTEARRIDFDDPGSLASGFSDVQRLLIVSTDELAAPGKRQRQHAVALSAALGAGVKFVAYTSMPDPANSPAIPFAPDHLAMEVALAASGLGHAVLRNGWYQENLLAYLPQIIADGTWFTAAGDGRMPYVARADAACAAAAVLANGTTGIFDIAGPQSLTVENIAAAVREALGHPLTVAHVHSDRVAVELARQGVPAAVIPMVTSTEANQRAGRFEVGAGDVERLTGRKRLPFADFLRAHADTLLAGFSR